jgi:hypothetical protein
MISPDLLERYRAARYDAHLLTRSNNAAAKSHGSTHVSGAFNTPRDVVDAVEKWRGLAIEIADVMADAMTYQPTWSAYADCPNASYQCLRCGTTHRIPSTPVHCLDCERAMRAEMSEVT